MCGISGFILSEERSYAQVSRISKDLNNTLKNDNVYLNIKIEKLKSDIIVNDAIIKSN
jgi:uncharacterized FlaG/YvyC family protein